MFDLLARIHRSAFPTIIFLSKSEVKHLGNFPASDLKCSSVEVMDVGDKYEIPYNQQYRVATSTKSGAYQCPPKATQSPNTMSIWTLSRYCRLFFIGFPLGGLDMVSTYPMVDGRRPELARPALVAAVR